MKYWQVCGGGGEGLADVAGDMYTMIHDSFFGGGELELTSNAAKINRAPDTGGFMATVSNVVMKDWLWDPSSGDFTFGVTVIVPVPLEDIIMVNAPRVTVEWHYVTDAPPITPDPDPDPQPAPVPEPATALLIASGLAVFAGFRRKVNNIIKQ